jgi:hypothetical protein
VWISFLAHFAAESGGGKAARDPGDLIEEHATARYAFLYRRAEQTAAYALISEADAVHDRVAAFLGATPLPHPITVDTTSALARHNAGQAYWKKIRMHLGTSEAGPKSAAVLGHETVHVYLDQLSDLRLATAFDSTRWFHEGVASYVEHRFFQSPEALAKFRRSAAVAHAWQPVQFADLAKDSAWARKRDRNLVYPLGEIFCAALVETYGDLAPGQVARAFTRPNAPKNLAGADLWRDTLQACGFSLEAVLAAWRAALEGLVLSERAFIDSLPRLRATITAAPDEIVLTPAFTGTAPGLLFCEIRPSAEAADYEHDTYIPQTDGTIRIPRRGLSGATFWYQLGWRVEASAQPLYEPWVEAPVP